MCLALTWVWGVTALDAAMRDEATKIGTIGCLHVNPHNYMTKIISYYPTPCIYSIP